MRKKARYAKLNGSIRKLLKVKHIFWDRKMSVIILGKKTCRQHIYSSKNAEFTDLLLENKGRVQNQLPIHTRWKTNKKFSSAVPASVLWNSDTGHLEELNFYLIDGENISEWLNLKKIHLTVS